MNKTMQTATVVAVLVTAVLVTLNGLGCHMMGLRHSGAHMVVEGVGAFLVAWVASVALLATRTRPALPVASREVAALDGSRGEVAQLREELAAARATIAILSAY